MTRNMTETFATFIAKRKSEIQSEIEELYSRLAELKLERDQIAAAEYVRRSQTSAASKQRKGNSQETIKSQVVKILKNSTKGLKAIEIQEALNREFNRQVKRESLSPQLSRLASEGVIEKTKGMMWVLPVPKPTYLTEFEKNLASTKNGLANSENPKGHTPKDYRELGI